MDMGCGHGSPAVWPGHVPAIRPMGGRRVGAHVVAKETSGQGAPPMTDVLTQLSDALAARVAAAAPRLAAIRLGGERVLSGIAWRGDLVVTSEQALPEAESYEIDRPGAVSATARLVGRDPGTNVALLRLPAESPDPGNLSAGTARIGGIGLVLGAGIRAEPVARLALIRAVGPAWRSMAGGTIDQLVRLDVRASRDTEGGAVIDAAGGLIGMATAGPRGRALVIPHATVERAVGQILTHGTLRSGWLGVGLQPVAVPPGLREAAGQETGLMVVSLAPAGPAEQAGLLPGDILLAMDGEPMTRLRSVRGKLGRDRVGQEVDLRLMRAGAVQTVRLTVAARPGR